MATKVSVIIPTYNYAHFVADALDSVLRQDSTDLEIIVVDDGSTDETPQVVERYGARVRYIFQENAGLSAARNTGLSVATGSHIQFLDADDMLSPGTIASQLASLERAPRTAITVCRNRFFRRMILGRPLPKGGWHLFPERLDVHLCYFNIAPPHAFLLRREAAMKIGGFDTTLPACEDYDYWLRAAVRGFVPRYNPDCAVFYRRHRHSMSANLRRQHRCDAILHNRLATLLAEHPDYPRDARLEGLWAFCAGALVTAGRLRQYEPDQSHQLIELARARLHEAMQLTQSGSQRQCSGLARIFCLRTLGLLYFGNVRICEQAAALHPLVMELCHTMGAPRGIIPFWNDMLRAAVPLRGATTKSFERRVLRRLLRGLFRGFVKNRFGASTVRHSRG